MFRRKIKDCKDAVMAEKFNERILEENSKRFAVLLGCIAAAQVLIFIAEITGMVYSEPMVYVTRAIIFTFSLSFALILYRLRKNDEAFQNKKLLGIIITFLHFAILAFGSFFTAYMFTKGNYTYTMFIVASLIISISHLRWPYLSAALIFTAFTLLNIYLYSFLKINSYFLVNSFWNFILLFLISVVNLLNNKLFWRHHIEKSKISQMNEVLTDMSQKDALTGLYNRRRIIEDINKQVELSKRYNIDFCVVMIDLDRFKRINDRFGHAGGDLVLKEISGIISDNLRENDVLGRWGGEEFILIIPNANEEAAFNLVERMRKIVQEHQIEGIHEVTFSAGICGFTHDKTADQIIDCADFALYISKQQGRNQVNIYEAA